jgi:nitrogen fixation NifU-like protein
VNEDQVIEQVAFSGKGCAISQASASMLTEMLEGKTLAEAKKIGKEDILEALGIEIGPVRLKCALLSLKVLKAGVYGLSEEDWNTDEDW